MKKYKRAIGSFIIGFIITILLFVPNVVQASNGDIIIMLDPGHGGEEPGAGGGGLVEKELNWKIAAKVKEIFDETAGITGILTRNGDETVSIADRGIKARDNGADLLVSFHINSSDVNDKVSGAETYITANTNQKRYYEYSKILGESVLANLRNAGVRTNVYRPITKFSTDGELYADGFLSDWYGIIRNPMYYGIPGMIIEHAYINNPYDRTNYLNDNMLEKMAKADAKAIIDNKELFRRNYQGNINTELIEINYTKNSKGANYINGSIYIAEWVNGNCQVPNGKPKLTLKSTDGKVSKEMYVSYEGGIKYYFDRALDGLDNDKEYYIEAKLTASQNTAPESKKIQKVRMPDKILKENYGDRNLKIVNNKLVFSEGEYQGDIETNLEEIKLIQNAQGETYVSGFVNIAEIRNNEANVPKSVPEIWLKSTDGEFASKMYVGYENNVLYYFDKMIEHIDLAKEYYLEAKLTTEENTSNHKQQIIEVEDKEMGSFHGISVMIQKSQISFSYEGNVNTEMEKIQIIQNSKGQNYISGYIYIAEWVDGICRTPSNKPKITLKATDGSYSSQMYVGYENSIQYYFDKMIDGLDQEKDYIIEVELTNQKNTSTNKTQIVALKDESLEKENEIKVEIRNSKMKIIDLTTYYGHINTELADIKIIQNAQGQNYISGYIYIAEWVEGECRTPAEMPILTLKSTDGEIQTKMYVGYENSIQYYFDKMIEDLPEDKQYYIEAKLTSTKNQSPLKDKIQNIRMKDQEIGICTNGNKVSVVSNKIIIQRNLKFETVIEEKPVEDLKELEEKEEEVLETKEEEESKDEQQKELEENEEDEKQEELEENQEE